MTICAENIFWCGPMGGGSSDCVVFLCFFYNYKHTVAPRQRVKKVKVHIALYGSIHDRATERHLPYGIT